MGKRQVSLLLSCLTAACLFFALGVWQLERRAWKLDLIARVGSRIHARSVAAPKPSQWPYITPGHDEYRRVSATGYFLHTRTTLVDALTERGAGFWVMTPLRTDNGTILINRGFVPTEQKNDYSRPQGVQQVTGLLRMTEPKGRFLRPNRPQEGFWYSRDVEAIAVASGSGKVAPFFIDAEPGATVGIPVAGMTVVQFRNMHLVYALTWFSLAGMALYGAWQVKAWTT